jgi:hypothetical protein
LASTCSLTQVLAVLDRGLHDNSDRQPPDSPARPPLDSLDRLLSDSLDRPSFNILDRQLPVSSDRQLHNRTHQQFPDGLGWQLPDRLEQRLSDILTSVDDVSARIQHDLAHPKLKVVLTFNPISLRSAQILQHYPIIYTND